MKPDKYIADFDSASAMLRATARFLHGQDFPALGTQNPLEPVIPLVNWLPRRLREQVYIFGGWQEAIKPEQLGQVRAEDMARWAVQMYPRRRYPAAAIGSSNGALVHLYAALGIPWLPQTLLIPVRRSGIHPDDPQADMEWARKPARTLLDANPELQLHHMHDANQDRLMIQRMTYFRTKRLTLGESYTRFLEESLLPGATIFLIECGLRWPTTQVDERHIFQNGALGGSTSDEFIHGSVRVAEYLKRYKSDRRRYDSPQPDGERPEAEWGFEPSLRAEVEALARRCGYKVRRIVFGQPEALSPLIADLYRWWYAQRGIDARRLLIESFILMEPYWTLRTGSIPFWMVFNMEPSAAAVEQYLNAADSFDEIYAMLFAHGVDSVGLVPIERWRSLIGRARQCSDFIGVDERAFPRDFATFARYYPDLKRKIKARYPLPQPLSLAEQDAFLAQADDRYGVQWRESYAAREQSA